MRVACRWMSRATCPFSRRLPGPMMMLRPAVAERAWRRNGERRGVEELVDRGIRELDRRAVVVGAQRAVRSARDIRRVTGDAGRQRRAGQPGERRRGSPAAEDASPETAVVQPAFVRRRTGARPRSRRSAGDGGRSSRAPIRRRDPDRSARRRFPLPRRSTHRRATSPACRPRSPPMPWTNRRWSRTRAGVQHRCALRCLPQKRLYVFDTQPGRPAIRRADDVEARAGGARETSADVPVRPEVAREVRVPRLHAAKVVRRIDAVRCWPSNQARRR